MSPKRSRPGPAEATDAARRFLTGLAHGADLDDSRIRFAVLAAALAKAIASERGINLDSDPEERTDTPPPSNIRPLR